MVEIGETINTKYRVVRLIGDGGMGSVYEARHELLGTNVALKFLHPEIAEQESLQLRFMQEARVSAAVRNPHIVRTLDVETYQGAAFLVMELLEGEPLSQLLERNKSLPLRTAMRYAAQLLDGVAAAHTLGIVHRDLKPDNIFITKAAGEPLLKILDFGIAKLRQSSEYKMTLTRPGAVMGTPEYMAPEQAFSADLADTRSDVYSMGVILFEMLSGQVPVRGDNPQLIAEQILTGKALRLDALCPELPAGLVNVIHRAMAADPDERWSDAAALSHALLPFVPSPEAGSSPASVGAAAPFQAIAKTPRIDGSRDLRIEDAPRTRVEPRPRSTPVPAEPREPFTKTAPDSRPPIAAGNLASPKTQHMASPSTPAGGGASHARQTRLRNQRRQSKSSRSWIVTVAALSLLVGAGVAAQVYVSQQPDIVTPPRPTRRLPAAAQAVPVPKIEEQDDVIEELDAEEDSVGDRDVRASRPAGAVASPVPMTWASGSPVSPSGTPLLTLPSIQLPTLPSVLVLPTSLPAGLPTLLPFPLPQSGAKP